MTVQQIIGALVLMVITGFFGLVILAIVTWLEHKQQRIRRQVKEDKSSGNRYPWEKGVDE